ncbi:molybdopterin converting factor subunit 1 [Gilvimarinus sp. DA14]|uniref:molybdopterin converting factor subunit 1 n=1 Tax=Gilvimarinus sp. DA14 TaxID=2956798 RepID=UPI0020B678B2|nr:molybdopterin converting factor subunit 1 [Gilvimarinus sp. DA14]UTF61158.1 molybdopterin converting factor subunit 1 [Gilvimarinus sp. DA14]
MIRVLFFAQLRESLGCDELKLDLPPTDEVTVADLLQKLQGRGPHWQSAIAETKVLVAVNQQMVKPGASIADGDEVAIFPPVTGG